MIGTDKEPAIPAIEADQGLTTRVLELDDGSTTRALGLDGDPTIHLQLANTLGHPTGQTTGVATLLFGLSLAAALPPAAMLFSPDAARPIIRPAAGPMLSPSEVEAIVGHRMKEAGRGRIALGEVDRRLSRLLLSLEVFQATDRSGVLVCLGVIRVDSAATTVVGASPLDLWALAGEPLSRYGVAFECPIRIGDRARLVVYSGITMQIAWLSGDRLMTASVTSLTGSDAWAIESASALAIALDRQLS